MKKTPIKSNCLTPRTNVLGRRYTPLGKSIRQGFVDGISEDVSPLLHSAFDQKHRVQDPYFSFGNSVIGLDKFERSVKFSKQRESLEKDSAATSTEAASADSKTSNSAVQNSNTEQTSNTD